MHTAHENILLILLCVLGIAWLIQVVYYLAVYIRMPLFRGKPASHETHPVSVILCAKNELENLKKYLPLFLEQAYPDYEVIVVDDCSWDESGAYLDEMKAHHAHLRVVTLKEQERYRHGKKFALTLGIKAAKHEYLLLSDADCMPAGKNWLAGMQSCFRDSTELVLGYGAYLKQPGLLNKLIRFDTVLVALQYFSFSLAGMPYMGVGRNLAYRRSLFFRTKGFARHNHIVSGDDDLFVNENASKTNTDINLDPETFTYSPAKQTFREWYRQKLRHTSTGRYYKSSHKFLLALHPAAVFFFYAALIGLLCSGAPWQLPAIAFGSALLVKLAVVFPAAIRLRERDVAWLFPVFEPVHLIVQCSLAVTNLFRKQKLWK
jgi:biofilm PGA synthesis N-glycosyltransferase PgaC